MEVVYSYTRANALADGVLVDLNKFIPVKESGFRWPIACTDTVWATVEEAVADGHGDYAGITWDMLWMARHPVRSLSPQVVLFRVKIGGELLMLKIHCGPGDEGEPVLTIMYPHED